MTQQNNINNTENRQKGDCTMTVSVPGYSTLTGSPETILSVLEMAHFVDATPGQSAADTLRTLAENNIIEIKEDFSWQ